MAGGIHCTQCGLELKLEARFCTGCGTAAARVTATVTLGPVGAPAQLPPGATAAQRRVFALGQCHSCGGGGAWLPHDQVFCPDCRWLRPLAKDYRVPVEAFMWSFDARAMATLRKSGPLNGAANFLSDKVGQPWFEASVNGIRLGPDQLPDIFGAALDAARALGLTRMPQVYVSGDMMWDCLTLGSDDEAFIVIGSVLTNMKGPSLRFMIGREMGHVAAGHAMWKTVLQFLGGKGQQHRTIMGNGVLDLIDWTKLVKHAIDAPLMAWARQSEITADRAGALAVGDREACRQAAIQQTLRSFPLFQRLNMDALDREIAASGNETTSTVAEFTLSTTPYLGRRLKLLDEYFKTETLKGWRAVIDYWTRPAVAVPSSAGPPPAAPKAAAGPKVNCPACGTAMRVPKDALDKGEPIKLRCPNAACGKVLQIGARKPAAPPPTPPKPAANDTAPPPAAPRAAPVAGEGLKRIVCPACTRAMLVPAAALAKPGPVDLRCPNTACGKVLRVKGTPPPAEITKSVTASAAN